MTERKPPGLSFPGWVEQQIREAEARGAFAGLPGAGKPIPGLGEPRSELAWIVDKLRREDVGITGVLPPALALAKELDELPALLDRERSEARVRSIVEDLDARIRTAQRAPQVGPPLRVRPVDVAAAVAARRERRPAPAPAPATVQPTSASAAGPRRRAFSRLFRRR